LHVPIEKTPKKRTVLQGEVKFYVFFVPLEMLPFHVLADRCKRLSPLLAAPAALLLVQGAGQGCSDLQHF
jgi:hypothetical protein